MHLKILPANNVGVISQINTLTIAVALDSMTLNTRNLIIIWAMQKRPIIAHLHTNFGMIVREDETM